MLFKLRIVFVHRLNQCYWLGTWPKQK